MIRFIQGKVKHQKDGKTVVVTADGVGWFVQTSQLCKVGDDVEMYVHTQFKETEITLWGFKTYEELELFELLLGVSGVGAKTAQLLLNEKGRDLIIQGISLQDPEILKVSGIGKKTAEKIIFTLKDSINRLSFSTNVVGGAEEIIQDEKDVIEALIQLGYARAHVIETVKNTNFNEDLQVSEKVKLILHKL